MKSLLIRITSVVIIAFSLINLTNAAEKPVMLKPFTLAKIYNESSFAAVVLKIKNQLTRAGFKIVGVYEPYDKVNVIIVTDKTLLKTASKTQFGGFGAGIRVSVTQAKNGIQVAHTNPSYMAIAYNMKSYLTSTRQKLAKTLGYVKDFGGKGVASNELADYHYGFGLERFNQFMDLAEHKSHKAALKSVENGFAKGLKNMEKVYRIDIPGKEQSIFGISLKNEVEDQKFLNDKYVMDIIDNKELHRSAHLPYELMVVGKRVIVMHPHFRLAVNFPDLRMFGKNSFGKIMDLPYVYEEFFIQLAGGVWPIPDDSF